MGECTRNRQVHPVISPDFDGTFSVCREFYPDSNGGITFLIWPHLHWVILVALEAPKADFHQLSKVVKPFFAPNIDSFATKNWSKRKSQIIFRIVVKKCITPDRRKKILVQFYPFPWETMDSCVQRWTITWSRKMRLENRDDPEIGHIPFDRGELVLQDTLVCFSPTLNSDRRDEKNFVEDGFHGEIAQRQSLAEVFLTTWMQMSGSMTVSLCSPRQADHFDPKTLCVSSDFHRDMTKIWLSTFLSKIGKIEKNHRKTSFFEVNWGSDRETSLRERNWHQIRIPR